MWIENSFSLIAVKEEPYTMSSAKSFDDLEIQQYSLVTTLGKTIKDSYGALLHWLLLIILKLNSFMPPW